MAAVDQSAFQRTSAKKHGPEGIQQLLPPKKAESLIPIGLLKETHFPATASVGERNKKKRKKINVYRLLCLLLLWQLLLGSLALGTSLLSGGVSSCDELLQVLGSLFSLFLSGFYFAELLDEVFFFCHLQTRARKGIQSSRGGLASQGGHLLITALLWASRGKTLGFAAQYSGFEEHIMLHSLTLHPWQCQSTYW